jgi:nitrogen fixation NifU-like protein
MYYNNLQNIGDLDDNDANVGTGIVGSPLCGDVMKIQLRFDENNRVIDAKYKVFGCVSAIASMELACTLLKGKTIEEAKVIENKEVADKLELSTIKRHCSVLAKEAIIAAVDNYMAKKENMETRVITISKEALDKIKEIIKTQEDDCVGVGVAVSQGGCSGIEYSLFYVKEQDSVGKKYECFDGVHFYYDEKDAVLINGVNIDVVENSFGQGFSVTNKNQFSCQNCTCRCM